MDWMVLTVGHTAEAAISQADKWYWLNKDPSPFGGGFVYSNNKRTVHLLAAASGGSDHPALRAPLLLRRGNAEDDAGGTDGEEGAIGDDAALAGR